MDSTERLKAIQRRVDEVRDGYNDTDLLPLLAGLAAQDVPWLLDVLEASQRENQALKAPLTIEELERDSDPHELAARDYICDVFNAVIARRSSAHA